MILAGDVGGTKVHLALYKFAGGRLQPVRDEKFPAHEFAGLEDVVKKFLADGKRLSRPALAARGRYATVGSSSRIFRGRSISASYPGRFRSGIFF